MKLENLLNLRFEENKKGNNKVGDTKGVCFTICETSHPNITLKQLETVYGTPDQNTTELIFSTPHQNATEIIFNTPHQNTTELFFETPLQSATELIFETPYKNATELIFNTPHQNLRELIFETQYQNATEVLFETPHQNTTKLICKIPQFLETRHEYEIPKSLEMYQQYETDCEYKIQHHSMKIQQISSTPQHLKVKQTLSEKPDQPEVKQQTSETSEISESTKQSETQPSQSANPILDSKFAWVIAMSSFIIGVILGGLSWSFGLIFKELLIVFGEKRNLISWIQSVQNGTFLFIGPLTGFMMSAFDCRRVGILGALILSISIFASSFATRIPILIVLYGLIGGVGYGFLYLPSITIVGFYFKKRRGLATSLAVCGSSVGGFVFAPITECLLQRYSWKGTWMIMSAICLNGLALSMLFRPIQIDKERAVIEIKVDEESATDKNKEQKDHKRFSKVIKSLLKNPVFLIYAVSGFLTMFAFYVPLMYIPQLAIDVGLASSDGQFFVAAISLSNTVSRLILGAVADRKVVDPVVLYGGLITIGGVVTLLLQFCRSFELLMVYSILFGVTGAAFITLRTIILSDLFGVHLLPHTLGLATMFQGVAALIGPPITGAAIDGSGSYIFGFAISGGALTLAGVLAIVLHRIKTKSTTSTLDIEIDVGVEVDAKCVEN